MFKPFVCGLLAFLLAGCAAEERPQQDQGHQSKTQENAAQAQNPGSDKGVSYRCKDGKILSIDYALSTEDPGSVRLVFEKNEVTLTRAIAASGEKYSDGTWTWWGKGKEGFLMQGEAFLARDCLAQAKL